MGLAPVLVAEIFEFMTRVAREGASLLPVEQYVANAPRDVGLRLPLESRTPRRAGESAELTTADLFAPYIGMESLAGWSDSSRPNHSSRPPSAWASGSSRTLTSYGRPEAE